MNNYNSLDVEAEDASSGSETEEAEELATVDETAASEETVAEETEKKTLIESRSLAARLLRARLAHENAWTNPEISAALAEFGYDAAKFEEGQLLVDTATTFTMLRKEKYALRVGLNERFRALLDDTNRYYLRFFRIARNIFSEENGAIHLLELKGDREDTIAGNIAQVRLFFTNALKPDILAVLTEFNITADKLNEGLAKVNQTEAAYADFQEADSLSQQLTMDRDTAFEAMEAWIKMMLVVAESALCDRPQLLEALGLLIRSATITSKDRQKKPPRFPLPPFDFDTGIQVP